MGTVAEVTGSSHGLKNVINAQLRRLGYEIRKAPAPSSPAPVPPKNGAKSGGGRARNRSGFAARQPALEGVEGMTSMRELERLYSLARGVESGCIVEVGSYRGRSTAALGLGSLDGHRAPVFAIEPHESFTGVFGGNFGPADRAAFYRAMLATGVWEVVRLVNLSSEVVAAGWTRPVGMLWLDGDHTYEGVRRDYRCWEPHLEEDAVLALDDASAQNAGPARLVDELVQSGRWEISDVLGKMRVLRVTA
jgi:hypothetical protein